MVAHTNDSPLQSVRIIRRPEVQQLTGLSRSGIYARINQNSPGFDPTFPQPINLGGRSVGWLFCEVQLWLAQRIAARSDK